MWRYPKAFVIVIFTVTMTFSAAPAEAGRPCLYWVLVSREGFPQENLARVCREDQMGTILEWMRVVPGATVSHRAPQGPLNDGFTVTVGVFEAGQEILSRSAVLTVRVYPVAPSGPAAFVPTRTLFHGPKPSPPGFVVSSGWRSLDLYVARRDGVILGCFMLDEGSPRLTQWLVEHDRVPTSGVVGRVAVAREASGRGLGLELLDAAAELAAQRGIPFLRLECPSENVRLCRYYLEAGFSHCGDNDIPGPSGEPWVSSVFERPTGVDQS